MSFEPKIERVGEFSDEIGVNLGFIGMRARYLVTEGRFEVQISYWFRLDIGFKTITIRNSMGWVGCEEGVATALALAEKFELDRIELCDPDNQVSERDILTAKSKFQASKGS